MFDFIMANFAIIHFVRNNVASPGSRLFYLLAFSKLMYLVFIFFIPCAPFSSHTRSTYISSIKRWSIISKSLGKAMLQILLEIFSGFS
jgi:hypothetical protein